MALIICPDCKKQISDRAERCPHCGLPAQYFHGKKAEQPAPVAESNLDYANLGNISLEDNNAVFNLCCRLCSTYERKSFLDGLQYGAYLIAELYQGIR